MDKFKKNTLVMLLNYSSLKAALHEEFFNQSKKSDADFLI